MNNKRKLLLALSGASASAVWAKPVIKSTVLPVHAESTTEEDTEEDTEVTGNFVYSETMGYDLSYSADAISNQTYDYDLLGATPTGDGTVVISNLQGDIEGPQEQWTIAMNGVLGNTHSSGDVSSMCNQVLPDVTFIITSAQITAAINSDKIRITATQIGGGSNGINRLCAAGENIMNITLSFPAI
jgi:hypothetical protein